MVFGEVISKVVFAFGPVDKEIALAYPVPDPVKMHVHGFGAALFDSVIGNAGSTCIVSVDMWCGLLLVSEFSKGDA